MRPLPVLATIREAYDFTFANLGAIIGLIWVPMVLVTVGEFFVTQHFGTQVQEAMAGGDANAAAPAALALFFFALGALGLYAIMLTAVTQLALGQRQGGAMFHFAFGALEWRVFRNLFALTLFLLPGLLLMSLGMGAAPAPDAAGGLSLLIALVVVAAMIFFAVRVGSVLLPVTLHEEKQALVKSWALTGGNVWRLAGVFAGVLLPVYFLTMLMMAAVLGGSLPEGTTAPTAEQIQALRNENLPMLSGLSFFVAPLLIGLTVGASVISWRKLTAKTDILA